MKICYQCKMEKDEEFLTIETPIFEGVTKVMHFCQKCKKGKEKKNLHQLELEAEIKGWDAHLSVSKKELIVTKKKLELTYQENQNLHELVKNIEQAHSEVFDVQLDFYKRQFSSEFAELEKNNSENKEITLFDLFKSVVDKKNNLEAENELLREQLQEKLKTNILVLPKK